MSLLRLLNLVLRHPVNAGQAGAALSRLIRWQVASRLAPGPILVDWVGGARFLARRGETGLTGNVYTGLHEFPDMAYVLHVTRPDDLFVDVGANAGSYTLLACAARGARGIAFEPVPATYQRLLDNLRLNQLGERVAALNMGAGATDGELAFTAGEDTMNHALAAGETAAASVTVPVMRVDTALRAMVPALLKIDVEGFEQPVLEGAQATLADPALHSVIMELNGSGARYGFDESRLLALMLEHGFGTYAYDPAQRQLHSLGGRNRAEGNTLFVRDLPRVTELLRSAPAFSVHGKTY